MSFQKSPSGTRGARVPAVECGDTGPEPVAMSWHRRSGDKFQRITQLQPRYAGYEKKTDRAD
jgi:hypothetical protein